MVYEYKMIQLTALAVRRVTGGSQSHEMAAELQRVANEHAADGWDFYRVDEFTVVETAGCLGGLVNALTLGRLGGGDDAYQTHVITFRRQK